MGTLVKLDLKPRFHRGIHVAFSLVPLQSVGKQSEARRLVRGWRLDAVGSHPRCHLGIVDPDGIGNGAVLLGRALLSARLAGLPLAALLTACVGWKGQGARFSLADAAPTLLSSSLRRPPSARLHSSADGR